ncbi:hypothetical protein EII17_07050 [Clostridiales bacterium COT073_COT-073]|nr:hypothetical protein EII17_07050 [Clostridiales bacterium COT073_COT-073]
MFVFAENVSSISVWLVWLCVFSALFCLNEATRRFKWVGFGAFVVLPIVMTILWLTALKETSYMDWFHLVKVYSSTAGCIGFWCIRHIKGASKIKWLLWFPPLILAINIAEAVGRDFEVGFRYVVPTVEYLNNQTQYYIGGSWNIMNAIAGILNIVTITGWTGICIRRQTVHDGSKDMIWPDMLWFWIIAYDLWNFAYTYNCLPTHAWYCGFALLLAPTLCSFTVGKGAWLQHRAHTLALWCMFAQTFPAFQDAGKFMVHSLSSSTIAKAAIAQGLVAADGSTMLVSEGIYQVTSAAPNTTPLFVMSLIALLFNIGVFAYMIYKVKATKRNPYTGELYTDLKSYQAVKEESEDYKGLIQKGQRTLYV